MAPRIGELEDVVALMHGWSIPREHIKPLSPHQRRSIPAASCRPEPQARGKNSVLNSPMRSVRAPRLRSAFGNGEKLAVVAVTKITKASAYQLFRRQQSVGLAGALALLVMVGILDAITGYQASLTLFYAIPIMLAVWHCRERTAVLMALACSLVWCGADVLAGHHYDSVFVHAWEISVRTGFFFAVGIAGLASRRRDQVASAKIQLLERAQQLEHQVIEVSEYEQQRIGRDLHDGLCQYFAAVACSAVSLRRELEKRSMPDLAILAEELADSVSTGVVQTRNLSHGLMPVEIGHGGLAAALQQLANSTTRLAGVACTFECEGAELAHHDIHATHLVRIVQEAINNAIRHGRAKHIEIVLTTNEHVATLSVSDDGIGLHSTQPSSTGMGISIMRYRANSVGGELLLEDRYPRGTIVSCTAPAPQRCAETNGANSI